MNCPKCGAKIGMFNLRQNCQKCGVNIMYYTQEADLVNDAKKAELEFALARTIIAKVKAAFIGGKLQIARLVFLVLIIALLLPGFAGLNLTLMGTDAVLNVGGLPAYQMFSNGILLKLIDFAGSTLYGTEVTEFIVMLALFVLVVLLGVANFALLLLSFLNINKTAKISSVVSFTAAGLSVLIFVLSIIFKATNSSPLCEFTIGIGGVLSLIIFGAFGFINLKISRSEINVKYKENDLERKSVLKQLKSGEVKLDDLSLPVFETNAEKEKRLADLEKALQEEGESDYE